MSEKGDPPMFDVDIVLLDLQKPDIGIIWKIFDSYPGHQEGKE